jgi:hypothetical protein
MTPEIAQYTEAAAAALAGQHKWSRAELLEDLAAHLEEVAADVAAEGGTLADRLGPPDAYAAELRSALGSGVPRTLRDRVRSADRKLGRILGYASLSALAQALRPAWWLARGYLAAMVLAIALGGWRAGGAVPRPGGSSLAGVLLTAVCVVGSLWLGKLAAERRTVPPKLASAAASAALAVFAAAVLVAAGPVLTWRDTVTTDAATPMRYSNDVVVVDGEGRLVGSVQVVSLDRPGSAPTVHSCESMTAVERQRFPLLARLCAEQHPRTVATRPSGATPGAVQPSATPPTSPSGAESPAPSPSGSASPSPTAPESAPALSPSLAATPTP